LLSFAGSVACAVVSLYSHQFINMPQILASNRQCKSQNSLTKQSVKNRIKTRVWGCVF